MFALSQSPLASHSDVFRGSSRVLNEVGTRDEPLERLRGRLNPRRPDFLGYLCGGESLASQKVVNAKELRSPAN